VTDERTPPSRPEPKDGATWVARLMSGEATASDHVACARWRSLAAENEADYQKARLAWRSAGAVKQNIRTRPARWRSYGAAAAAALALCVTLLALVPALRPDAPHKRAIAANALEMRSIALRHGDVVALNVNSELSVIENGERTSVLLDRGEAYFSVQPGQRRTFVVEAGAMQVTVTGTAFEVARFEKNAIVAVERGSVQVRVGQAPVRALRGGDRLLITADGNVRALSPIPPELVAAWQDGQLIFMEEPLSLVFERIQLYTPNRIRLAASVNADLLVSATFANEDFASVLDGLDQTLPVSIERSAAGDIQVVAD